MIHERLDDLGHKKSFFVVEKRLCDSDSRLGLNLGAGKFSQLNKQHDCEEGEFFVLLVEDQDGHEVLL